MDDPLRWRRQTDKMSSPFSAQQHLLAFLYEKMSMLIKADYTMFSKIQKGASCGHHVLFYMVQSVATDFDHRVSYLN